MLGSFAKSKLIWYVLFKFFSASNVFKCLWNDNDRILCGFCKVKFIFSTVLVFGGYTKML